MNHLSTRTTKGLARYFAACAAVTCSAQAATDIVNSIPANNQATLSPQAGQTFTTPALGADDRLSSITLRGPSSGSTATVYTMKVWVDTDGDFDTWDPGALVATSTNALAITNGGDSIFTFSNEALSSSTVYAFSMSTGGSDHVAFRPGLTNGANALADGAVFSSGVKPFAFDVSFIVTTTELGNQITWNGDVDTTWDLGVTANWEFPDTTPTTFAAGNEVTFDDTDPTGTVVLTGTIEPGLTTFDSASTSYTLTGAAIAGTGPLLVNQGSVTLLNDNTSTGSTTIASGATLALGNGGTTGSISSSTISNSGQLTISRSNPLTINSVITGSGSLLHAGSGTTTLSGASTFTGGTTITDGTVVLGAAGGIGRSGTFGGAVTVVDGTFDVNGQTNYVNASQPGGPNTWLTTATVVLGGEAGATPEIADSSLTPAGIAFAAGSALTYDATNDPDTATISARWTQTGTFATGTRTVTVGDSAATNVELDFTGGLGDITANDGRATTIRKIGPGTMRISSENTFPGLSIGEGTLLVNDVAALGADRTPTGGITNLVTVDGTGTLDLNGFSPSAGALSDNAQTTGTITNSASATTSILSLGANGTNGEFSGVIADGAGIVGLAIDGGSLTLGGAQTYTGTTTVNDGTLRLNTSSLASAVSIEANGDLATGTDAAAGTGTLTALDLNGGSTTFRISDLGSDKLVVTGNDALTINGGVTVDTVDIDPDGLTLPFTTTLIEYTGTIQGSRGFDGLATNQHGPSSLTDTGTTIDLTFTGDPADTLIWVGNVDGNWTVNGDSNWKLQSDSSSVPVYEMDKVLFDDTATGPTTITLTGSITPETVEFNNTSLDYTLQGSPISGSTGLLKNGTGTTTILADSTYTGGTTINGGTLAFGNGGTEGEIGFGATVIAGGATLELNTSDSLNYKATPKLRDVSGAGDIVVTGGGLLWNYTGGGLDFAAPNTWSGFSGDLIVKGDSEFQTIRNGATAMGTGAIILGDGSSSGNLSQIEGNWTWTNPIEAVGSNNQILNRSGGSGRALKIQGAISGAGNLTFSDIAGSMTNPNVGFVLTNDVSMTGTLTIDAGTPLRVGSVPGDVDAAGAGLNADSFGSLGTTTIVNDGLLTFSRTDSHSVGSPISGAGAVRIGIPSDAGLGDSSTQVVTFSNSKTYTGSTTIEAGELVIPSGVNLASDLVFTTAEGRISGAGTLAGFLDVEGTLAPGTDVGTLTTLSTLTFFGDSTYEWSIDGWDLSFTDSVLADSIDIFVGADGPVTVAISPEAIGDFSETTKAFIIAGSNNPITGFTPGDIVIDDSAFVSATGANGTWSVGLTGDSLAIELVYTAGTPDGYTDWIDGFFMGETDPAIIGFDADPDGDGIENGVENFLGTAPNAFSAGLTLTNTTASSLTATHTQSNDPASDVTAVYEWSSDLTNWNISGATDTNGVTADITTSVTDDQIAPLNDTVEVTATISGGSTERIFLRINASLAP